MNDNRFGNPVVDQFIRVISSPGNVHRLDELTGVVRNRSSKTLGGKVFWDTVAQRNGLRLQHNKVTGHYRVLDPDDIRKVWGTKKQLLLALKQFAG